MTAPEIVVPEKDIEAPLDLRGLQVPRGTTGHPEALVEQRAVHALDEAVGARRVHARGAMLDPVQAEQQLVGMHRRAAAELTAVVGEDGRDWDAKPFVEGQNPICIADRTRSSASSTCRPWQGPASRNVADDLDVDFADALEGVQK